jgi:hypothetical protein
MLKKNVPQDGGILDRWHEIKYAIDDDDRYVLAPSVGWEELSPLAYYMVKNQMDINLLAKYVRLSRWRVRRHLKPAVFRCLKTSILERYAKIFNVSTEQLFDVPESSVFDPDNGPK